MTLVLEIEFLTGTCFAALGPDSEMPEWPPQPDRVFSALVAAWGARGEREDEAAALRWLEHQPAPLIDAGDFVARCAPTVFVPPNDPSTGRSGNRAVVPTLRSRQPRRFPAARPVSSTMSLVWQHVAPEPDVVRALECLAADVAYVGHSISLTRCRLRNVDADAKEHRRLRVARRWVYPGRLQELRRFYEEFTRSNGRRGRPVPGAPVRNHVDQPAETSGSFSKSWLILEHCVGVMPDVRASAIVSKCLRDTLMAGYARSGHERDIPEAVSGHRPDGSPSPQPHLAIVPLTFTGFPYADGHVMGFALVPPEGSGILKDPGFLRALRAIAPINEELGRRVLVAKPSSLGSRIESFEIGLSPTMEAPPGKVSLAPHLYTRASTRFATVTPIVLDRHLKQKGQARIEEISKQIGRACENVGLPSPFRVVSNKHSTFEGAPSAFPSGNAPGWMRWRLPPALNSRQLIHAVIQFESPVHGPVLIGAGRYVGMGLMRPIDQVEPFV